MPRVPGSCCHIPRVAFIGSHLPECTKVKHLLQAARSVSILHSCCNASLQMPSTLNGDMTLVKRLANATNLSQVHKLTDATRGWDAQTDLPAL